LEDALREASAKISILKTNPADPGLTYGEIPIVVAKCGVFLKNNGLNVEGIFRVGGSSKRLKELQVIFNTPPDFGKKLNWDGYNVHDAASILRRYLNALPQPLIPLDLYESFRDPLRSKTKIVSYMKYKAENPNASLRSKKSPTPSSAPANITPETPVDLLDSTDSQPLTEANIGILNSASSNSPSYEQKEQDTRGRKEPRVPHSASVSQSDLLVLKPQTKVSKQQADEAAAKKSAKKSKNYKKLTHDVHEAIDEYKQLVNELPTVSKQLLFYILDLLAMVQNHSDENLMSSRNLAAIFQPSILSHPNHDMDPVEYALSQHVVEFLIQYAYKLLPKQINPLEGSKEISDIENDLTSLQLDGVGVPPVGSPAIETTGLPSTTSNVTSTSTTPIDADPSTLLSKPPRAPFKRQYSNSLPSSNQDDLVGYRNKSKQIPMLDSDNEFEITDEDDNDIDISDLDEMNDNLQLNRSNGGDDFVPTEEIKNFEEPNEIINPDEQPKSIETKQCHQPRPSANVAIIVSTPSSSAVPRVS
jgi:RhoGAP domain.